MKLSPEHTHAIIIFVLCALIFGLVMVLAYSFLQPKGRVSCADFGSYSDIQDAFHNGATYLDKNHDGIPCNARK